MTHTVSFYMLKFSRSWIFWQESFHVVDYLPLKIELTIYVANWPMNVQREMTYVPYNGIPVLILNFYLSDELILGFRTLKWIFYLTSFILFCNIQFDVQSGQVLTYILSSSSWQKWNDFEIFLYYYPMNRKKFAWL